MWDPDQDEIDQLLSDWYYGTPGPEWLEDMIAHYQRNGFYRPEDLYRLFGDINEGVTVDPDESLEDFLKAALQRRTP
jgi:hypothetical protein